MLAFKAGLIHRDLSDGNIMIKDGGGFLLDFDYAFNWKEALELAGWQVDEENWAQFVEEYDKLASDIERPVMPGLEIPLLVPGAHKSSDTSKEESWQERMKMKERTVSPSSLRRVFQFVLCDLYTGNLILHGGSSPTLPLCS